MWWSIAVALASTTVTVRTDSRGATYTLDYGSGERITARLSGGPLRGRGGAAFAQRLREHIARNSEAFRTGRSGSVDVDLNSGTHVPRDVEGGIEGMVRGRTGTRPGQDGCVPAPGGRAALGVVRSTFAAPMRNGRTASPRDSDEEVMIPDHGDSEPAPAHEVQHTTQQGQPAPRPAPQPRMTEERVAPSAGNTCLPGRDAGAMLNWNRLAGAVTNPDPNAVDEVLSEGTDIAPHDPVTEAGFVPDERYLRLIQSHVTDPPRRGRRGR